MQNPTTIDRRTFVTRAGAVAGALALAGCAGTDEDDDDPDEDDLEEAADEPTDDVEAVPELIEVEDPPDAVYVPTHREAMRTLEPVETGDVAIAPMLSYPHPFWIVAGGDEESVSREEPEEARGVHLMFTVWDRETGVVLPVDDGAQLRLERDGEGVGSPRSPWTMISQEMGFHFGDNVTLPEDGTYTVEVELPPLSTRLTGDLEGRLDESVTATFEFEYDDEFRQTVVGGIEYLDEDVWGERGALEPMEHGDHGSDDHDGHVDDGHDDHHDHSDDDHGHDDHDDEDDGHDGHHDDHGHHDVPYSALPEVDEYPGTVLVDPDAGAAPDDTRDLPSSGDARFLATLLESDHRLADDEGHYLLVSPRTPYNRVPLADAFLSVTIEREGSVVDEASLEQTIDGTYDLHYGAVLADVEAGDTVTVEIESPPQVARHQGYETAFLEMPPVEFRVPEE